MEIRALVFDLEGTLYNSKELADEWRVQVFKLVREKTGRSDEEILKEFIKITKELEGKGFRRPPVSMIIERVGITREEFYKAIESVDPSKYLQPDSELRKMLEYFKSKWRLAMLTNLSRKSTLDILSALGLDSDIFDPLITASEMEKGKPDPEPFRRIIKDLDLKPSSIMMVGDSISSDLEPARKVGMKTVLISEKEITTPLADLKVKNIQELMEKLEES
ncbi:MAG: HAD family hydrolase [Candidatus Jordarchaeum sp.]|uniref:HAD family hydrolase n=1 Tax=Candidatus Jordarchaeum sp. TaxID=2823881 RepID=UPI00404B164E